MKKNQTILIDKEEVADYIPQKPPIVMVDRLFYCDESKTISGFEIRDDNMFVQDGELKEPGIIENMAQTAALKVGYESKKNNTEPVIGYIGAIKNLKIYSLPKVGEEISTETFITHHVFNITLVKAKTFCNEKLIAECEMKMALANSETN